MKRKYLLWTVFFAALLFNQVPSVAQEAQVLNPLYVQARGLWQQLSASSIDTNTKASYGQRFGDLAREQQRLWNLAGQVDQGQCTDACASSYNDSIGAWQSALQTFNNDATETLEMFLPKPGVWKEYGPWHQVKFKCFQKYVCVPNQTFMAPPGTRVVSNPANGTTAWGTCIVGKEGDPESCGDCAINPPTDSCQWHLEK